jgi:CubicO group peptidase (beta-lactamase class C family)
LSISVGDQAIIRRFLLAQTLIICWGFHQPILAAEQTYSNASLERLKADFLAIMEQNEIPGASISIVAGREVIWVGGLGKADIFRDVDATADSVFRVGSVSKSFTGLALMKLVEQGRLDLDMPVRDLASKIELTNPWSETYPMTVAHTLEHTTGFDDMHFVEIGHDHDPTISLEAGLAFHPHSRISRWAPGTHMSYSNSGPAVAARILERVTGQSFESYVEEQVFANLGMESSSFHIPDNLDAMSKGYQQDSITEVDYEHPLVRPSGALNTTARDMGHYLQMMIHRGAIDGRQVYHPETIRRIERPTTTLAAQAGHDAFGYGVGNYATVVEGHRFRGHKGSIRGFIATTAYSPELQVGYFVSLNKLSGGINEISSLIVKFLTAGKPAKMEPVVELDSAQIDQILGYYQAATPRTQLTNFIYSFL